MQKLPSPYDKPSLNSATRNYAPQSKQTMPWHMQYSPTKSYPKHSRPWTCVSTGYGAAMPKDSSVITGDLAHKTWQITSPSITSQHTTSLYAQQSSRQSTIQNTGNSSRTQETPQNWRAQIITRETKTSKNRQKSLKRRAQKITRETKLPKISKNCQVGGDNKYPTKRKFAVLPKNCGVGGDKKYPPKQKFEISPKNRQVGGDKKYPPKQKFAISPKIAELEGRNKFPKHDHSKKCLRILRQGCVIPTNRYVPIGGKRSLKNDPHQMHKIP
jgi:hypothetical protein